MPTSTNTTPSSQRREPAPDAVDQLTASLAALHIDNPKSTPTSSPKVRPFNPATDLPGIEGVFRLTYASLYRFEGLINIAFIVLCRAYLDISPETCFVLSQDDPASREGSPRILGYIVGTPSSSAFCAAFAADVGRCRSEIQATPAVPRMEEMRDPALQTQCMEYFHQRNQWEAAVSGGVAGIERIVFSGAKAALEGQYAAHFHVTVSPEARGKGSGSRLLEALCTRLAHDNVRGVFAAVPARDEAAGRFYERCGFTVSQHARGTGADGMMAERTFMVKNLSGSRDRSRL